MKYCHKCGASIKDEDLVCTSCGSKQKNKENNNQLNFGEDSSANFNDKKLLTFKQICLNMILKPVTGIKEFVASGKKSFVIALTLCIIFMQGFSGMWKVNQIFSTLGKLISELKRYSKSGINSSGIMNIQENIEKLKKIIDIPYGKIFFQNICVLAILVGIIFIITYFILNIILKQKHKVLKIYTFSIGIMFPIVNFKIISILCSYLSFFLGLVVMIIGIIISIVCFSIVLQETFDVNENKVAFIVSILFVVIFFISVILIGKFIISDINNLTIPTKFNF